MKRLCPNGNRRIPPRRTTDLHSDDFDFPRPPESLPSWALEEGKPWRGLDTFDILVRAETMTGKRIDLRQESLPPHLWGLHVVKGERARLIVNRTLPFFWRRFALFHELYHLLAHRRGEAFWARTATPLSSFEAQADLFAWAAAWPDYAEIEY